MKRWMMRGLLAALLFMTARYTILHSWPDVKFICGHFFDILAGEAECPEVNLRVLTALISSAGLAGMLINTTRDSKRKDNSPSFFFVLLCSFRIDKQRYMGVK